MAAEYTQIEIGNAFGLYSDYSVLTDEQKESVVYYCTDTSGAYKGCIVWNGQVYGQGTGGVTSISPSQDANGAYLLLTFGDGTSGKITLPIAGADKYGVVKTTSALSNVESSSVVPTAATVYSALLAKANVASPSFTGTPTAPTAVEATKSKQIATTEFVHIVADAAKQEAIEALLGENVEADYDTLKEIADYIASDKTGAAEMQTAISNNAKSITDVNNTLNTLQAGMTKTSILEEIEYKIGNFRASDVLNKVGSIESDTLDVEESSSQAGKQVTVELKDIHSAESIYGATSGPQSPSFGGTFNIYPVKVDKQGRVVDNGSGVPVTIPGTVATASAKGLMSAEDKSNLDKVVQATKWIKVTS